MRPQATSVCGLKLLVYAALSYECMRPSATSVCGLKVLLYAALSYDCMRPSATSLCGLKLSGYMDAADQARAAAGGAHLNLCLTKPLP